MASEELKKKKLIAGILAICLGAWGVHKFYLGYTKAAVIQLILGLTCVGTTITSIVGIIEGVMYLTKSDEEFESVYVNGDKDQIKFF